MKCWIKDCERKMFTMMWFYKDRECTIKAKQLPVCSVHVKEIKHDLM